MRVRLFECGKTTLYEIEVEAEAVRDGLWIAEIPDLPGCMCYGETRDAAIALVIELAHEMLQNLEE